MVLRKKKDFSAAADWTRFKGREHWTLKLGHIILATVVRWNREDDPLNGSWYVVLPVGEYWLEGSNSDTAARIKVRELLKAELKDAF